jgi:hypothetical protein
MYSLGLCRGQALLFWILKLEAAAQRAARWFVTHWTAVEAERALPALHPSVPPSVVRRSHKDS